MKHASLTTLLTALCASVAMLGCDDNSAGGSLNGPDGGAQTDGGGGTAGSGGAAGQGGSGGQGGQGGSAGTGGMGGSGGGLPPDAAAGGDGGSPPDDAGVQDGSVEPDMNVAPGDAAPPPLVDAGVGCADEAPDFCGPTHRCVGGECQMGLHPNVYRMVEGDVTQPEAAAGELQLALQFAVAQGNLNLMFEAAGYTDGAESYQFNVGTGTPAGGPIYAMNHALPVQNVFGLWRMVADSDPARPTFVQDGEGVFNIVVPTGTADDVDEDGNPIVVTCRTNIPTTVQITVWPLEDSEEGTPRIGGSAIGYILADDVDQIEFSLNGQTIRFADFLEGTPPDRDADGDGTPDAYDFSIVITAEQVDFNDPDPARDPNIEIVNPAVCD